ncbi:DUF3592 domain-containing protein [Caballeronia sp. LZ034LL]|uniref:DUF3592 domain-containing protein n=1 Tax=Caballeronia sp. LZ034LL TaxID=3038567 RepID=UPI0028556C5A|nr:DUF3592 domain-containing protein [Caballeronia sp. LZ034LL]MDR5838847.1 DUF3592 domain-containing protein [Caballeronia sp. LZ034LL]
MKRSTARIDWVTVFLGVCLIAIFGQFTWMDIDFYLESTVTVGEVVKLNHGGYHPEVSFTTDKGVTVTFPGSSTYPVEVGDRLEVRYLRSAPGMQPKVNQTLNLFDFMPLLFGVVVVISGLMGKSLLNFGSRNDQL